jgi:hypothetical protein
MGRKKGYSILHRKMSGVVNFANAAGFMESADFLERCKAFL